MSEQRVQMKRWLKGDCEIRGCQQEAWAAKTSFYHVYWERCHKREKKAARGQRQNVQRELYISSSINVGSDNKNTIMKTECVFHLLNQDATTLWKKSNKSLLFF